MLCWAGPCDAAKLRQQQGTPFLPSHGMVNISGIGFVTTVASSWAEQDSLYICGHGIRLLEFIRTKNILFPNNPDAGVSMGACSPPRPGQVSPGRSKTSVLRVDTKDVYTHSYSFCTDPTKRPNPQARSRRAKKDALHTQKRRQASKAKQKEGATPRPIP